MQKEKPCDPGKCSGCSPICLAAIELRIEKADKSSRSSPGARRHYAAARARKMSAAAGPAKAPQTQRLPQPQYGAQADAKSPRATYSGGGALARGQPDTAVERATMVEAEARTQLCELKKEGAHQTRAIAA